MKAIFGMIWLGLLAGAGASEAAVPPQSDVLARGEQMFHMAGCENCHTDRAHGGQPLAGGLELKTPLGTFFTPNISPDPETGIGRWSEQDFTRALREGRRPDGANYYPSFPYTSYTRLSDQDIHALWTYLRSTTPVRQADTPHQLPWYLGFRPMISFWKILYFKPGTYQQDGNKSAQWNRGAYLVQGAGHCNECHTQRNALGGLDMAMSLAGTAQGPEGARIPNITPDKATGIGAWKPGDLVEYFRSGLRPDGDYAGGLMAELIDNGFRYQSLEDIKAIAVYLEDGRAVIHDVGRHRKASRKAADEDY